MISKCTKLIDGNLICPECNRESVKNGRSSANKQRYLCKHCKITFQKEYKNKAYMPNLNNWIKNLLKEGCGILSIARLLHVSPSTVQNRIDKIAKSIEKPILSLNKTYEMDELCTYIGSKDNRIWIAYAIRTDTKEVVDFRVGKRTNKTLRPIILTMQLTQATRIYTDKLLNYRILINKAVHSTAKRGTNHIERMNLTLRTHLKRLSRRSICYSKSMQMLKACLTIYFWG